MYRQKESIAYAEWLNTLTWHIYATLTTRYPMTMQKAIKLAEELSNKLRNYNTGIGLFFVAEPFDITNGYHIHALIYMGSGGTPENNIRNIAKAWQEVSRGGRTDLSRYDYALGANYYLSKYMLRNNADYNLLGEKPPLIIEETPIF